MELPVICSAGTMDFLRGVSLPREEILLITFLSPGCYYKRSFLGREYTVVGVQDLGGLVGVSLEGQVFSLEEDWNMARYMNLSLAHLAALLKTYREMPLLDADCAEEVLEEAAAEFEKYVRETDPTALENRDSFWPLVVEQMRDGLL